MRFRYFILVGLLLFMGLPSLVRVNAFWSLIDNEFGIVDYIAAGDYIDISANRGESEMWDIDLEVTQGGNRDINFYVFDSDNYVKWTTGILATASVKHEMVTTVSVDFEFPKEDRWYIVLDNIFSQSTQLSIADKTVELTVDLYVWEEPPPGGLPWEVLLLGLILTFSILTFGIMVRRRRKGTLQQQPTVVQYKQPPQVSTGYCPHCGRAATWIQQYGRFYCYNCKQYV